MFGRVIKGITAGAIIGAAAGMMILPQMDRGTRRRLKKTGRVVRNTAGNAYDNMRSFIRWVN